MRAIAALLAGLLLAGCHPAERAAEAGKPSNTAVIQFAQEPETLDPYLSALASTNSLASLFYSGLVQVDDHGEWVPDLATRVPTPENGDVVVVPGSMRVTYHLRPDVRWQDGKPVTSQDVAATLRLIIDPRFPGLSRAGYELIRTVETPDAQTAVLVFSAPYAPYLELFPYVLPAHVITAHDHPEREPWNRAPVGSGPYVFKSWANGDRLVATANPGYFRGEPGVPRIVVRFVGDDQTALSLFRSGELDLFQGAAPTQLPDLKKEAKGRVSLTPTPTWEHILFNLDRPALKDVRVRRAIAHLINRKQLNDTCYGGACRPAWSEVPLNSWAYDPKVENRYPYDPAVAASLLDEAGWKKGPDGIRQHGGQKLHLQLITTTDKPGRALAAQLWRRQWHDAGIDLGIERLPAAAIWGGGNGRLAEGSFDLALIASSSRPDPDTSFRWSSNELPPVGQNRSRYRSDTADLLLTAGEHTIPRAARKRIYARLAEQLSLDLPVVPLLYWVGIDATSSRLSGYKPNPTLRGNLWNVWEWKLKPS